MFQSRSCPDTRESYRSFADGHLGAGFGGAVELGKVQITECVFQESHVRMRARGSPSGESPLLIQTEADAAMEAGSTVALHVQKQDVVLLAD